jgi:putative transcriptional regulator
MPSLKGHFLIATPRLVDPNFARSVVLILQHDENGAMGVIINRPLSISVKEACAQASDLECEIEAPLHSGGPCEGPLIALHTRDDAGENQVMGGVSFAVQRSDMEELLQDATSSVKFIANYAGWGPAQLESEIEEGSWLTLEATAAQVFATDEDLWDKLLSRAALGHWVDPSRIPDDPSLN